VWALRALSGAALLTLSSCGDGNCRDCFFGNPVVSSSEVSFGLAAGNFANNGFSSIVTTSSINNGFQPNPGNLKVYLASGPLTYAAPVLTADGNDPDYLAAADLNGDHLLDVVSSNAQDGTLAVFFNNAQSPGTFNSPLVLNSPGASQLAIADMNGDGLPDLISADFNVSLFVQSSAGTFASPISLYSGGANWVAAGDLNHDGSPDIALTDNVGVKILFHTGAASATTFAAPVAIYSESSTAGVLGANIVAIADVDGDGYSDLIITDPGPAGGGAPFVAVLRQNPASPGTFLAPVTYATATGDLAQSIQVVDINGDGHPDIVIGGTAAVSVLLNNASSPGTFAAAAVYAAPNANQIAIADVNGDGLPDIVVATGPTQTLTNGIYQIGPGVLLQNAASLGTFGALQQIP
jgi:FG-GAP-like repeat